MNVNELEYAWAVAYARGAGASDIWQAEDWAARARHAARDKSYNGGANIHDVAYEIDKLADEAKAAQ